MSNSLVCIIWVGLWWGKFKTDPAKGRSVLKDDQSLRDDQPLRDDQSLRDNQSSRTTSPMGSVGPLGTVKPRRTINPNYRQLPKRSSGPTIPNIMTTHHLGFPTRSTGCTCAPLYGNYLHTTAKDLVTPSNLSHMERWSRESWDLSLYKETPPNQGIQVSSLSLYKS